jgi:hypothetical protein
VQKRFITYMAVLIAVVGMTAVHADDEVKVPFVGCPSDGQLGLQPPSIGTAQTIHISFRLPGQIAFYDGVFAPVGWHCLVLSGSAGVTTIVSAKPIPKSMPMDSFDSPVIELSSYSGDTSGRFDVARLAWMLFPNLTRDYVKEVEDEGIVPKSNIEVPKYQTDHLTYLNKKLVAFETPANMRGLGTDGRVKVGLTPITGLVALSDGDDGMGISILRISLGTKDDVWNRVLVMLNTPCMTGSCQTSNDDSK